MLSRFDELLSARYGGTIVGAFTCYNFETASGVLQAAARMGAGVVLLVSERSFRTSGGDLLLRSLLAAAEQSPARACVQIDHVSDLDLIHRALELGVGAVMADGSQLPFEDNVAFVSEAVNLATRFGASVEAELGRITGDEDVAAQASAGALTNPDEAVEFVERTGAACLAVSIGNVHGHYREPPRLDFVRLKAIRGKVSVPLSLHGASGISDEDLRRSIRAGIGKVNVNTELRERYLETTASHLEDVRSGLKVLDLNLAQAAAVEALVTAKLATLSVNP